MRVLGIDLGMKRTGLAMSDELGISVGILPNLHASNRAMAVDKIMAIALEHKVAVILIGRPEPRTDHSKALVIRVDGLIFALAEKALALGLELRVLAWDESYSSKRALENLVKSQVPKHKRKQKLDGAAAAIMVEDFLRQEPAKR